MYRIICHTLYGCVDWNYATGGITAYGEVTPCMGVWIETIITTSIRKRWSVTPCMGVWIETTANYQTLNAYVSHTLYGCVDWNLWARSLSIHVIVTPCMGVWIETPFHIEPWPKRNQSHPVWVCGLKQFKRVKWYERKESHPVWVCGLKLGDGVLVLIDMQVTPCMGVWIETCMRHSLRKLMRSHPVWVCGLKLYWAWQRETGGCHTLYGCVDWNFNEYLRQNDNLKSHPVWVCGLKLALAIRNVTPSESHPVWVCGLKQDQAITKKGNIQSHPVWVCGLKPRSRQHCSRGRGVTPCMGVWTETVEVKSNSGFTYVTPCMGVWIETY